MYYDDKNPIRALRKKHLEDTGERDQEKRKELEIIRHRYLCIKQEMEDNLEEAVIEIADKLIRKAPRSCKKFVYEQWCIGRNLAHYITALTTVVPGLPFESHFEVSITTSLHGQQLEQHGFSSKKDGAKKITALAESWKDCIQLKILETEDETLKIKMTIA